LHTLVGEKIENTDELIRRYFSKGNDLNTVTQSQIDSVVNRLDNRPRKTQGN